MLGRWLALPFAGLIISQLAGAAGAAAAMPACGNGNPLYGIAATSARNIWAVGECSGAWTRTLIERWNGRAWKRVASPNPGRAADRYDDLNDVAAVSKTRAWAVGQWGSPSYPRALILSWNGSSWRQAQSPSPGGRSGTNELYGVAATSASDAWAVGDSELGKPNSPVETLILHWTGHAWRRVPSPHPGPTSSLDAVTAVSGTDAWAVGFYRGNSGAAHTLTEHWNGKRWRQVPSPDLQGCVTTDLADVSAAGRSSAWAVGFCDVAGSQTVSERWTGSAWQLMPSPDPGTNASALGSVIDVAAQSIWATGYYSDPTGPTHALLLRWTGTAWQQTPVLGVGTTTFSVGPIAAVSRTDMWALGTVGAAGHDLVLRWNGTAWRRVTGPG